MVEEEGTEEGYAVAVGTWTVEIRGGSPRGCLYGVAAYPELAADHDI